MAKAANSARDKVSARRLPSMAAAVSQAAVACPQLVASVARTTQQATIVGGVGNILMGAIGGIMVPKFMMPATMQTLAAWSPMAWGLDGFHSVMLRGGTLADLWPTLGALLAFAVIVLALAIVLHRRQQP